MICYATVSVIFFRGIKSRSNGSVPAAVQVANKFPALILADHRVLYRPTHRELAQALGLQIEPQHEEYDVVIIGGGNSAGQAAMYFSSYARRVSILIRGDSLEKSMLQYLIEQLRSKSNIRVEADTTVVDVCGGAHIESICTKLGSTGAVTTRPADGLGYICTGRDIENPTFDRAPFPLETSIPGIFAAGDVRSGSVKRVASGVGEGSMVISFVHQYLELTREEVALV